MRLLSGIADNHLKHLWKYNHSFTKQKLCFNVDGPNNVDYANMFPQKEFIINPQGFRSEYDFRVLPKDSYKIGFFGCSFTQGIGLVDQHIWTHLLTERIKDKYHSNAICLNFGMGGCSNDYIFWNLVKAVETFCLDFVFILYTTVHRRLFVNPKPISSKFSHWINMHSWGPLRSKLVSQNDFDVIGNWEFSDEADQLNTMHNVMCCRSLLEHRNIPYVDIGPLYSENKYIADILPSRFTDGAYSAMEKENRSEYKKARDNIHPGVTFHRVLTNEFYKQYEENQAINQKAH